MIRFLFALLLGLGLTSLTGCPRPGGGGGDDDDSGGDDDDSTAGDDDDSTAGDDDDSTANNAVTESEPNDAFPFQDLGVVDSGRTTITGTLSTAGADATGDQWFNGDIDAFKFMLATAASVDFEVDWESVADDLDLLLFVSVTDNTELVWGSAQLLSESATNGKPEDLTAPLSSNVEYTVLIANFAGDPNAAYTLTIDVP